MCSNEIGDPKVDTDAKIVKVLSSQQRLEKKLIDFDLNVNKLFYLFNEMKRYEFVFYHGYPYPQTIPVIIYCNRDVIDVVYDQSFFCVDSLTEKTFLFGCLYLYTILIIRNVKLMSQLIEKGHIVEVY